ncbi:MAG: bifunctional sulfate adenylyltransferase/adenylylsulfate kinase [Gammaproteobacteria bacterium]|nr:bifunctional sulfate adenylyltransferase/adenylylsulfate kinase [Gammaproteobacteria bacterium]MBU1723669.1 bifunctional sulfate adenylyltransferase/adenylylsulfate kinase [Gammaproteobacteria bacterium]MBU2004753.1 bifunctional sulfate adenylyltransferase/adenylylsulfate kinase [Gammaproteobacteria bacterium]
MNSPVKPTLNHGHTLTSWDMDLRQLCDTELLLNGAFAPLQGFLNEADYRCVVEGMRLVNGQLWPIPITLDVTQPFADRLEIGQKIALRDPEGILIATLALESIWIPDKRKEALNVFGTDNISHPAVDYLYHHAGEVYLGGTLKAVELPQHHDYRQHRHTPDELKAAFKKLGWKRIIGFHTSSPMHTAQRELTARIARELEASLLIHPATGMAQAGDAGHFTLVRCYQYLLAYYPEQSTMLSLLPLATRMGGPREAVWHAIIRKNYGCTHIIIERDHASPDANDCNGETFYQPHDAQQLAREFADEIGIGIVNAPKMVYVQDRTEYVAESEVRLGETVLDISGAEFQRRLRAGLVVPEWFSCSEVVNELRKVHPPRHRQGFTVFFTGLSGAGKSTVAKALTVKMLELGGRPVTLLDGDVVRKHLSSELGFSREHRDLNIRRIGFVASEISKNGGIAICAPIAPYAATRREVREMVSTHGGFVEVYVATPIEECERRDRKGLYAKARAGLIKCFTGVNDPYEVPERPELQLDTSGISPDECAHQVLLTLERQGFIKS